MTIFTLNGREVTIETADVATVAAIAKADYPRLAETKGGFLGAGTHPAAPYLTEFLRMHGVTDGEAVNATRVGMDDARRIIITFLSNAAQWRGTTARAGKARLRQILEA